MSSNIYEIKYYDSLDELCSKSNINKSDILGNLEEVNNIFESLTILDNKYTLGLAYYNNGIASQVVLCEDNSILFIGFGDRIVGFNFKNSKVIFEKKLASVFYDFIQSNKFIIVICELDILVFSNKGKLKWKVGFTDIISGFRLSGDKLYITCEDGDETVFNVDEGTVWK